MINILTHPVILALGNALVNSMIQGLILFFIAAPLIFLFGKRKPEVAHWISMAALTLLLVGFTYSLIGDIHSNLIPSPQAETLSVGSGAASETAPVLIYMQLESWNYKTLLPYIAIMYVMGLMFFVIRFMAAFYNISLLRMKGLEKIPDYIHEIYSACAEKTSISKKVHLFLSSRIKSPVCFGYLKPVILFPVSAITQLSHEEIELIILHELAHIKRHDYLLKILQSTVQTILFFNPFCYFFSWQAELTRELCCDKMVIKMKNRKFRYAQTLLKLEEIKLSLSNPVLTLKPNQNQILNRIKNIMENKPQNPLSRALGIALILISLATLSWYSVNSGNAAEPENKIKDLYLNASQIQNPSKDSDYALMSDSLSERKVVRMETTVFGEIKFDTTDDTENNNVRLTMKDGKIKYLGTDLNPYTTEDIASVYIHRPTRSSDLHIIVNHESSSVEKEREQPTENKEESTKPTPDKGVQSGNVSSETVKGTVVDPQGKPLAGAAVRVQGTTQVSITGMDGTFTLENVNASQTLSASFTGYREFETQPIFDQPLEIRLKKDNTMPTVMVSLSDRNKDATADENDRLANTLIFIDGREVSSDIISTMNPSDIVSINVYKGEKAVEMFGERANTKEGVLYIVTREAGEKDPKTVKLEETISDDPDYGQMPFATTVEELPKFAQGSFRDWLSSNMQYPAEAKEAGLEGTVLVEFIIRKDGKLEQITIKDGQHPELFAEALRLVKAMPSWIPGKNQGEPVDVRFILPVEFVLK